MTGSKHEKKCKKQTNKEKHVLYMFSITLHLK